MDITWPRRCCFKFGMERTQGENTDWFSGDGLCLLASEQGRTNMAAAFPCSVCTCLCIRKILNFSLCWLWHPLWRKWHFLFFHCPLDFLTVSFYFLLTVISIAYRGYFLFSREQQNWAPSFSFWWLNFDFICQMSLRFSTRCIVLSLIVLNPKLQPQ